MLQYGLQYLATSKNCSRKTLLTSTTFLSYIWKNMSGETSNKIRIVRCPKCRQVLPERSNVPVYECGGCGTYLRAKIRKEDTKSSTSGLPETNAAETKKLDYVSEDKGSTSSNPEVLRSSREFSLERNSGRDQIESSDCHGDKLAVANLQNEDEDNVRVQSRSEDFASQQPEDVNISNDGQKSGIDKNESGVCENEQVTRDVNLLIEDHKKGSHSCKSLTCNVKQLEISNEDCSSSPVSGELPQSPLARKNAEAEAHDESSPLASKVEAEVDANHEGGSAFMRPSHGELAYANGSVSFATAHSFSVESISQDILVPSSNELPEQPQKSVHYGFDRVRSTDTFETTDFVTPSSELSGTLIDLSKSPTTRSSRAYYDDDVSSYEGTDDQLPNRHKYTFKPAHRLANSATSDVRLTKRERSLPNDNHEMQHHFRNSESVLPGKTHYSRKSSNLDPDEMLEPTRLDHPVRNWRRAKRDEYPSAYLLHHREPLASYESGSTSSQVHNDFYYHSSFSPQAKLSYAEQEKMKLLRMVYELQDQLNSTSLGPKANGGVTRENDHVPLYYDHEVLYQKCSGNLGYSGGLREGSSWHQQRNHSRIPFSAEATTGRHQVDHSLCCCPQLTPHLLQHRKGFCHVHPRLNLYDSYNSCPSSPQRNRDAEFPVYSRGTKSDDQRRGDREMKKYAREKHHLAKRHVRPIAGGAPLITCPSCLKQLQLPADFLLFRRRFHQLRCGACSEVHKFSLVNSSHLIPYAPAAEASPPSEVNKYSEATHRRNFTSTSHVSGPDPMSCSDDFTDRGPASQTPFHAAGGNTVERKVSYSSLDHGKERKRFVLNKSQGEGKDPVEAYESAGPSTSTYKSKKVCSEIEELPESAKGRGGSPLHQLMGYSSPSEVIFGWGPLDPGPGSYHPST